MSSGQRYVYPQVNLPLTKLRLLEKLLDLEIRMKRPIYGRYIVIVRPGVDVAKKVAPYEHTLCKEVPFSGKKGFLPA